MAKVLGLAQLKRQILALPAEQKKAAGGALVDGLEELAGKIRGAAQDPEVARHVSVKTGKTRVQGKENAMAVSEAGLSGRVVAETSGKKGEGVHNPFWEEQGTAPHSTAKGAVRAKDKKQDEGPQHPGTRARPFFWPTVRAHRKRLRTKMLTAANRAAKKVAGK